MKRFCNELVFSGMRKCLIMWSISSVSLPILSDRGWRTWIPTSLRRTWSEWLMPWWRTRLRKSPLGMSLQEWKIIAISISLRSSLLWWRTSTFSLCSISSLFSKVSFRREVTFLIVISAYSSRKFPVTSSTTKSVRKCWHTIPPSVSLRGHYAWRVTPISASPLPLIAYLPWILFLVLLVDQWTYALFIA